MICVCGFFTITFIVVVIGLQQTLMYHLRETSALIYEHIYLQDQASNAQRLVK